MNIAIFTIILSLKVKDKYVEFLNDLSGMSKKKPFYSFSIAVVMFSLSGIPPFAGFFGKFYIFVSAVKADLTYLAINAGTSASFRESSALFPFAFSRN